MATVLAKSGPLAPEDNLVQALREYEAVLSDDQRKQLHAEALPDAVAAIRLTSNIDKACNDNRRRCLGPRLIMFLEFVQQFSAVADTLVSSHPEVAALVWGGVKLALLAANNFSTYFDKLSALLMHIGKQSPRIHNLGSLYPSKGLKAALCDYSASIIRLCMQIVKSVQKTGYLQLSKVLFSSFDTEFGPLKEEIIQLSQTVRDEVLLAASQTQIQENDLQAEERSQNKKGREVLFKWTESYRRSEDEKLKWRLEIDRRKRERRKLEALKMISSYDHQTTFRQIRKACTPGTCQWIFEEPSFRQWMTGPERALWLYGKLGSGKSVATACVVAHLFDNLASGDTVSFFFCRFDDEESLKAKTVKGCIARQLLQNVSADKFQTFDHEIALVSFIRSSLSTKHRTFIVLDGLDECHENQTRNIIEFLHEISSHPDSAVKILGNSRSSPPNWMLKPLQIQHYIDLQGAEHQRKVALDIERFIEATLTDYLEGEEPELQLIDPRLVLIIRDTLTDKADGMFLWVKLQLENFCGQNSDSQILSALNSLPRDLSETFNRILSRCAEADGEGIGKQIFRWVAVAKRPLTLEELREAISIRPLQEMWEPRALKSNMRKEMRRCGHLILVDEERETVHFTHNSVKQYLLSTNNETNGFYGIDLEEADAEAGVVCVTYLNLPEFNTQVARRATKTTGTAHIASAVARSSLPPGKTANRIALLLLGRSRKSDRSVNQLLERVTDDIEKNRELDSLRQYAFLPYAKQFWLDHTRYGINPNSGKLWRLWCNLIDEAGWRDTLSHVPWTLEELKKFSLHVVRWISEENHCTLTFFLLFGLTKPDKYALELLIRTDILRRHQELWKTCWDSGIIENRHLNDLLPVAARSGHIDRVDILLEAGADINAPLTSNHGRTALQDAAGGGYTDIVDKLLNAGADINAPSGEDFSSTALQTAAEGGYTDIVDILLEAGADINAPPVSKYSRTALQAAAGAGYTDIVDKLLKAGADVNAPPAPELGQTALQAAARSGYTDIVDKLLKAGADVNAPPLDDSRTALQAAAGRGHVDIVDKLLKAGADINAPPASKYGRTALQAAAEHGHVDIADKLLQAGANINAPAAPNSGRTALQAAADHGYADIVDKLLKAGAEINAPPASNYGRTALQAAAGSGHKDIVDNLLKAGADVNAPAGANFGQTALEEAAYEGHVDVVDRLLRAGARKSSREIRLRIQRKSKRASGNSEDVK